MPRIESRLGEVLGRHRLKQAQLADASGLRRAAISALYQSKRVRVDLNQLASVIDALERLTGVRYTVSDLLVYIPDQPTDTRNQGKPAD